MDTFPGIFFFLSVSVVSRSFVSSLLVYRILVYSLCDFLFTRNVIVWFCTNGIWFNRCWKSFHARYCLILYKGYSEGFNLIDVERIFNHIYFNFVKYLNEIYLKVWLVAMVTMVNLVNNARKNFDKVNCSLFHHYAIFFSREMSLFHFVWMVFDGKIWFNRYFKRVFDHKYF